MFRRKLSNIAFHAGFSTLLVAMLVPLSAAQFKVTDNFNRPDGSVGLGWSTWGEGAQISSDQIETFGETDVAGGIERELDVTFPADFSFLFSTASPSDGGWVIGFNAASVNIVNANDTSEVDIRHYYGAAPLCSIAQTSTGPSFQCGETVSGQRNYTAMAQISGIVNADLSAKAIITYNDGLSPAKVTLTVPAPAGALLQPNGSILFLGNSSEAYGPHLFDNFQLTLQ